MYQRQLRGRRVLRHAGGELRRVQGLQSQCVARCLQQCAGWYRSAQRLSRQREQLRRGRLHGGRLHAFRQYRGLLVGLQRNESARDKAVQRRHRRLHQRGDDSVLSGQFRLRERDGVQHGLHQ